MQAETQMKEVLIEDIQPSKTNPRKYFDEKALAELKESVLKHGVIQSILLRPGKHGKLEIVSGERRFRVSKEIFKEDKTRATIPAIVRDLSDEEALEIQLIENVQRQDITPMEEAVGFQNLVKATKLDIKEIAMKVGKSASYVALRLKLTNLIEPFQKAINADLLRLNTALWLCRLSPDDQHQIFSEGNFEEGEVIEVNEYTMQEYSNDLQNAPFDTESASLVPGVGACTICPFNSANNSSLFPELSSGKKTCQRSQCFKNKCEASFNIELSQAKEDPTVIFISDDWENEKLRKELKKAGCRVYGKYEVTESKKADPAATRAFYLDGSNKGKYRSVKVNVVEVPKTEKKSAGEAMSNKEILAEVEKIQTTVKRKAEIDENKAQREIFDILFDSKDFTKAKGPLGIKEKTALIILLIKESKQFGGNSARDRYKKLTGLSEDFGTQKLYAALKNKNVGQLNELGNILVRQMILEKFAPLGEDRPERCDKAAILRDIATEYEAKKVQDVLDEMKAQQHLRSERMGARIKTLRELSPKPLKEKGGKKKAKEKNSKKK